MMQQNEIKNVIEAALLAYGKPINFDSIFKLFQDDEDIDRDAIRHAITSIEEDCQNRGVELKKVGSGYRFQAKQDYAKWLQPLWQEKPPRYSRALLETMVLIAYKQPITRGEIEDVRGVSVSSHIIKTLQERDWVRVVGHRDVPGKPALFATTKEFLDYFNLSSLEQLPSLSQIKDLDKINEELNLGDEFADTDSDPKIDGTPDSDTSPQDLSISADNSADPVELAMIENFLGQQDKEPSARQNESHADETTENEITEDEVSVPAAELLIEESASDKSSLDDGNIDSIDNSNIDVDNNIEIDSDGETQDAISRPVNATE